MNLSIYKIPDIEIIENNKTTDFLVWIPDKIYIVLGRSNSIETSVNVENANYDNIETIKRNSGGEAVILTPKTLVISAKIIDEEIKRPKEYFIIFNKLIIESLENVGIKNIGSKGISDLTLGDKKILGSSIYRKKSMVFYHSVLNVNEDINLISKYLKQPKKEPDYRKGRSHNEFVTSLHLEGYNSNITDLQIEIQNIFSKKIL